MRTTFTTEIIIVPKPLLDAVYTVFSASIKLFIKLFLLLLDSKSIDKKGLRSSSSTNRSVLSFSRQASTLVIPRSILFQ